MTKWILGIASPVLLCLVASGISRAQYDQEQCIYPVIYSVTHNGPVLQGGDTLVVEMNGTPYGAASFDLGRVARGLPMTETAPGRYEGSLPVRTGWSVQ